MTMRTLLLAALAGLTLVASCAVPPSVEGAPCPCPTEGGYSCDQSRNVCVKVSAPLPLEPVLRSCKTVGTAVPRPLSSTEYRYTVADLLGVQLAPEEVPGEQPGDTGYSNSTGPNQLQVQVELYRSATRMVADRARQRLVVMNDCDPAVRGVVACGAQFVERFGLRAFRRPLEVLEQRLLMDAFTSGSQTPGGDYLQGLVRVVEAALSSDSFLVRRERGRPPTSEDPLVALSPWEVATRLSFLLWASGPDQVLLDRAAAGQLATAAQVMTEVDRMLADPRIERGLMAFLRQWAEIRPETLPMDAEIMGFTQELRASIVRSSEEMLKQLVVRDDASLGELLTYPAVFADDRMARFFGLETPAQAFAPVMPLGAQKRFGLLTTPARLSAYSQGETPRPVQRGLWIDERLLCQSLPPPPLNTPVPPPAEASKTNRERYERHRQDASCSGCHALIDPFGFGLDNYDGLGRWRTSEAGIPVDASGVVGSLRWGGPQELATQLAASSDVRSCVVRQWFRYAFGRSEGDEDSCTLPALERAFSDGGYRTKALLRAIAVSDAFNTLGVRP